MEVSKSNWAFYPRSICITGETLLITVNPKAVYPSQMPKYESNAKAVAAGLGVGALYHNASGQVFIVMGAK